MTTNNRNNNTPNRNYFTISIPIEDADLIPKLQKAYAEEKCVKKVDRGEAVGYALESECKRFGV